MLKCLIVFFFVICLPVLTLACVSASPATSTVTVTVPPSQGTMILASPYRNQMTTTATVTVTTTMLVPTTITSLQKSNTQTPSNTASTTFQPITLTGTSDETTPPFTVTTKEWTAAWTYQASNPTESMFSFFIYPRGETMMYTEAENNVSSTGSTYVYAGPGDFYILVQVANISSWTITIGPGK